MGEGGLRGDFAGKVTLEQTKNENEPCIHLGRQCREAGHVWCFQGSARSPGENGVTYEKSAGGPSWGWGGEGGWGRQSYHIGSCRPLERLSFTLNELRKDPSSSYHLLNLRGDISIISLWWEFSSQVMSESLRPHNPPGSSIHGISQARILEWVAISFPGSSQPRDQTQVSCLADSLPVSHLGSSITLFKGVTFA